MDQILIVEHPLVRPADKIYWPRVDAAFANSYRRDVGAPCKVIGLMIGQHYLEVRLQRVGRKARQCYEFGQKVALDTMNRVNRIVADRLMEGNP